MNVAYDAGFGNSTFLSCRDLLDEISKSGCEPDRRRLSPHFLPELSMLCYEEFRELWFESRLTNTFLGVFL
jgi:hypothetical protein